MGIRYDHTPDVHTAYCDCGWIDLALTREGAWRIALEHESRVHPHRQQVRDAATKRERRAAESSGQCPPS